MLSNLVGLLVGSPLYPHWLEHLKMRKGNQVILKGLKGRVLEVGAGDGTNKVKLTKRYPKITHYVATDFSSWDKEFESFGQISRRFGRIGEIFMGRQTRQKLDGICSATDLPYDDNSFDVHLSFETLEHINDPYAYFSEAARVVKPSGKIILSVPFLYREHKMDWFRYTTDFFNEVAVRNNLKIEKKYINTGLGTTVATLANQWFIRRALESPVIIRPVLVLVSPVFFLINNCLGWLIDLWPDKRFATRYHLAFQKRAKNNR